MSLPPTGKKNVPDSRDSRRPHRAVTGAVQDPGHATTTMGKQNSGRWTPSDRMASRRQYLAVCWRCFFGSRWFRTLMPTNAEARVPAFWWIMVAVAAVLGVAYGRHRALIVAVALSVPQFVLAFWTAPRGDNDGLWGPLDAVALALWRFPNHPGLGRRMAEGSLRQSPAIAVTRSTSGRCRTRSA